MQFQSVAKREPNPLSIVRRDSVVRLVSDSEPILAPPVVQRTSSFAPAQSASPSLPSPVSTKRAAPRSAKSAVANAVQPSTTNISPLPKRQKTSDALLSQSLPSSPASSKDSVSNRQSLQRSTNHSASFYRVNGPSNVRFFENENFEGITEKIDDLSR